MVFRDEVHEGSGLEDAGALTRPEGIEYEFAGNYQNQQRAAETLMWAVPLALLLIFLVLYLQFASVATSLLVFTGVFVAWAGGFVMLWAYGQDWFLDIDLFGRNLRQVFQVQPINLSVAVWVGFLALFGIATDDGVIIGSYIKDRLATDRPTDRQGIRDCVVAAGARRIRPALMTVATTILALIPVLTSTGRGSDIMVPMAIPTFGGMTIAIITVLVVPTLYAWIEESKLRWRLWRARR
jgi:copper/silver efflux system protein